MEHTCTYLKNVWQNLKLGNSQNPIVLFIVLVLISVPLPYAFSSISIAVFVLFTIFTFQKNSFTFKTAFLIPILLFFLMLLSLTWSIQFTLSQRAIFKELPLLIVPICFFFLPKITAVQKEKILQFYSYGILLYVIFCLIKAGIRYLHFADKNVFFYHELVTFDVNAIHVSVFVAMSIFYFISKPTITNIEKGIALILMLFLVLLSSKNIIIVFLGLSFFYFLKNNNSRALRKYLKLVVFLLILTALFFTTKIKDRFINEFRLDATEKYNNTNPIDNPVGEVHIVNLKQAWVQDQFNPNDYFPGTALRIYQIRIFTEMLAEEAIFFKGYGLNATEEKISQKRIEHNLYPGYEHYNFHNEYVQLFAELGIFGLLLLIWMLIVNLKNAINNKDFMHISFAVLMISLFLTESFLSRQRGVVFFIMMYCVFNAGIERIAPKKI